MTVEMTRVELGCGGVLSIDLAALRGNYRRLRALAPASKCAAVVKADAYGLGGDQVVRALLAEGCRHFFVAHLIEALAIRAIVPREVALIVLHGALPGAEAVFADFGIVPVLNSLEQVAAWSALGVARNTKLSAWLQLDTGMTRFGLSQADLAPAQALLANIALQGVMSHFACADTPAHPANLAQILAFADMRKALPALPASLAASSGIFLGREAQADLLRPGAALYGINPTPWQANPMQPVVRLDAVVMQIREVAAGVPVGYGHTQTTSRPTRLATLGIGYADGYRRALVGKAAAWLGETALPLVGRVSMDSIVVDATGTDLQSGQLVELIGPHCDVDTLAEQAGTVGYEILTSLGRRFARRYVG